MTPPRTALVTGGNRGIGLEICRQLADLGHRVIARGCGRIVNVSSEAGQLSSMTSYAPAYSMSKTALNAFARQLAAATRGTGVLVNSASPGWVRTEMGGPAAPRSVTEGADTIVWLATLVSRGPTGGFFSDRKPVAW